MKYRELLPEASFENIGVLRDMIDLIMQQWPEKIPGNYRYVIGGAEPQQAQQEPKGIQRILSIFLPKKQAASRIKKKDQLLKGVDQLIEKYKDYPKIVRALTNFEYSDIIIDNSQESVDNDNEGWYYWGHVVINLAYLKGNAYPTGEYTLKEGLESKIKLILAHELRHYFQDMDFSKYMRSADSQKGEWNLQPIELDAEWSAVVSEQNVRNWQDPSEFADFVIDRWTFEMHRRGEKMIPDKIIKHYRRKTIKYFLQYKQDFIKNALKVSIRKNERFLNNAKDFVDNTLSTFKNATYNVLEPAVYQTVKSQLIAYWKSRNKQPNVR